MSKATYIPPSVEHKITVVRELFANEVTITVNTNTNKPTVTVQRGAGNTSGMYFTADDLEALASELRRVKY